MKTAESSRKEARRLHALGEKCERCGGGGKLERHHADGDPFNNARENIMTVCRRCHMTIDGRLEQFLLGNPAVERPAKPCSECGKFSTNKYLRRGLCHACNERKRRRACHDRRHGIESY